LIVHDATHIENDEFDLREIHFQLLFLRLKLFKTSLRF